MCNGLVIGWLFIFGSIFDKGGRMNVLGSFASINDLVQSIKPHHSLLLKPKTNSYHSPFYFPPPITPIPQHPSPALIPSPTQAFSQSSQIQPVKNLNKKCNASQLSVSK